MRVPLLLQVLIAVALGIVFGCFFPVWLMRVFVTFNGIFSQYLGFCIPLIIMGLVISGIAQLGSHSGKLLVLTVALAYGSTLLSGFFTYFCCVNTFPYLLASVSIPAEGDHGKAAGEATTAAAEETAQTTGKTSMEAVGKPAGETGKKAAEKTGKPTGGTARKSAKETAGKPAESAKAPSADKSAAGTADSQSAPVGDSTEKAGEPEEITPFFTLKFEPIVDVMAALLTAFILGIGLPACHAETLLKGADEFKIVIEKLIGKTIIPLLPLFIFGIFLKMTAEGQVLQMLEVFGRVIGVVFVLHFVFLFLQFAIAGALTWRNPFKLLWTMVPAYMTALGTSSSAATIPVTLAQVKKNRVNSAIAEFCVPLCSTIHLAGSTMKITAFSIAIVFLLHQVPTLSMYAAFIAMLGVTMVAAPGVPGGAIMAATAVLASILGFDERSIGLMISLYIATDCFGTACNVCGDGAISLIVDRFARRKIVSMTKKSHPKAVQG